jgi:hypothetical protein
MVRRDSLLRRNVAEHSFLRIIVSAHSLASLDFLLSDEFLDLKLQKEWVFQQTVSRVTVPMKWTFTTAKWNHTGDPWMLCFARGDKAKPLAWRRPLSE